MRFILLILTVILMTAGNPSPLFAGSLQESSAPDFVLKDVTGKDVSLSSLKGRAVMLNFWASWCPACVSEMPGLNKLHTDYKDKGFIVVGISVDKNKPALNKYLAKYPLGFTVLHDSDGRVSKQYGVFTLPTTFLLDKKGTVVRRYFGEEDWDSEKIRTEISKALN